MYKESTGTTIMATKYCDGIVIGADSRTSMGTYVSNRISDKLVELGENIFCCVSGSLSDTQMVTGHVRSSLRYLEMIEGTKPTVKRAAIMARNIIYRNPGMLAGLIIAGHDCSKGSSIFTINIGGSVHEIDWALGGSGSAFIYGYCDMNWKPDMSLDESLAFVKNSISCAIARDNMSGGCIRMAAISKDGVKRYFVPGTAVLSR